MIYTRDGYKHVDVSSVNITGNIIPAQEVAGNTTRNPISVEDYAFLMEFLRRADPVPLQVSIPENIGWFVRYLVNGFFGLKTGTTIYGKYRFSGEYINQAATVVDEFKIIEVKDSEVIDDREVLRSFYANTEIARSSSKYANGNLPNILDIDVMRSMYDDIRKFKRIITDGASISHMSSCVFTVSSKAIDYSEEESGNTYVGTSNFTGYSYGEEIAFYDDASGRYITSELARPTFLRTWWSGGSSWFWNYEVKTDFTKLRIPKGDTNVSSYKVMLKWEVDCRIGGTFPHYFVYKIIDADRDIDNFAEIKNLDYLGSGMCREILKKCRVDPDIPPSKYDNGTTIKCYLSEIFVCDAKFTHDSIDSPEVESLGWTY